MDLAYWLLFAAWLIAILTSFFWARKYFKLKKAFKNLSEIQTWAQTSFPGRRYHEDGGYRGGKTCIETDLELKMARARMEIEMKEAALLYSNIPIESKKEK